MLDIKLTDHITREILSQKEEASWYRPGYGISFLALHGPHGFGPGILNQGWPEAGNFPEVLSYVVSMMDRQVTCS